MKEIEMHIKVSLFFHQQGGGVLNLLSDSILIWRGDKELQAKIRGKAKQLITTTCIDTIKHFIKK